MTDTYKAKGLRKKLVESVAGKGIKSKAVLQAIDKIPRHLFVDSAFIEFAYADQAFPIGEGQTISQPYTVAFMSEMLNIQKGEKVLEIGTGSGYQACVLLELGARVFTIERIKKLYDRTRAFLPTIGYSPRFFYGDGYKGLPPHAPFDKIIVTAGAPFIPEPLPQQLKIGGLLVIPVGDGDVQMMTTILRVSETEFEKNEHGLFRFVPLLGNKHR